MKQHFWASWILLLSFIWALVASFFGLVDIRLPSRESSSKNVFSQSDSDSRASSKDIITFGCSWPWYCWNREPDWDDSAIYNEIVNFPEYPSKDGTGKKLTLFFYKPDDYNFKRTIVFDFVYDFYNTDDEVHFKYIWWKKSDRFSNVSFGQPLTDGQLDQIKNWSRHQDWKLVIRYKRWGYRRECGYDGGMPGWPCRYWELNHYLQITGIAFFH